VRDQNIDLLQLAAISSGLYRFLAIAVLLDVKDIPRVGPLQWGRIITVTKFEKAQMIICERGRHTQG
jgi:hypothetical protein